MEYLALHFSSSSLMADNLVQVSNQVKGRLISLKFFLFIVVWTSSIENFPDQTRTATSYGDSSIKE